MKKIDISFGIPVYNSEKYISELLKCFEVKVSFSYEIIIVNDGSTDDSLKIISTFKNNCIKIIDKKNEGVSCARNDIINYSSGTWITFVDSDDLIDLKKYDDIFKKELFKNYDYYINTRNFKTKKSISKLIENEIINSPWDKFYKREILKKNNIFFDKQYDLGEDLIFNLKYLKYIKTYHTFDSDMYIIRTDNNNSLSRKYRENKYEILMKVNEKCKSLINNNSMEHKALEYIRIKNCLSCIKDYIIYRIPNYKENIEFMKKDHLREFLILNDFKTTMIYNFWYILPSNLLYKIVDFLKRREIK